MDIQDHKEIEDFLKEIRLAKTSEDGQILKISELFGIEEKLKDEKGDFLRKIDGGSEPDPKFSNLEKHSSSEDFEPEGEYNENSEEEEEELGLSEI